MKKPETYKELAEAEARKQVERIAAACPKFLGPPSGLSVPEREDSEAVWHGTK